MDAFFCKKIKILYIKHKCNMFLNCIRILYKEAAYIPDASIGVFRRDYITIMQDGQLEKLAAISTSIDEISDKTNS